jgi:opacity protein-like surface antigen
VTDITGQGGYPGFPLPDLKNTSWKAYAGVRPLNWLAVELDYIVLGSGSNSTPSSDPYQPYTAHIRASAYAAYAVGFLPIPLPAVDIFGKVGFSSWKYDEQLTFPGPFAPSGSDSHNGTAFAWGIGAQAHINIVGARLEYEQFNIPNSSGAKVASLSVFLSL